MKKITNYLTFLLNFWLMLNATGAKAQCSANFNYTINANGNVNFLANCVPTNTATTQYYWQFGNSTTYSTTGTPTTSVTYTANGTYTVVLFFSTPPTCSNNIGYVITVTNVPTPTCNINPNFTYSQGSNGAINFTSTSTGTVPGTTYTWNYGDATFGSGATSSHTYASNGFFNVVLVANNNFTTSCVDSISIPVMVSSYPCTLTAGFNYTLGSNGLVNFSSVSTGTDSGTTYTWTLGDSNTGYGNPVNHVYANGTYTVLLTAMNSLTNCISTSTQVITVSNAPCNINANFSYTQGSNGLVNFNSTSTGTVVGATYQWNYGDASAFGSGVSTSHTYASNGTYSVVLHANNNFTATCADSVVIPVVVNSYSVPCTLNASFTYTLGSNGLVNVTSTSTGTNVGTNYQWQFSGSSFASGVSASHTYTSNGVYTVTLTAINNSVTCTSLQTQTLAITNVSTTPCNLVTNFSHTVGSGGNANFANTSTGTNSNSTYYWDFGDGYTGSGQTPSHTYSSAGAYNVLLLVNNQTNPSCIDTIVQSVNVTGIPCMANSSFSLAQTTTSLVWSATPSSPWNVVAATWSWGDNSSSNTLYTSHTYSASGTYSICLSVTVSCGASSTTCVNQFIFRSGEQTAQMIQVNVIAPTLIPAGIINNSVENLDLSIYPNPNNGQFELKMNEIRNEAVKIKVYNIMGTLVYETEIANNAPVEKINMNDVSNGVYFVKINSNNKEITKKIIVNK